jgi:hypothetical protein
MVHTMLELDAIATKPRNILPIASILNCLRVGLAPLVLGGHIIEK